MFIINMIDLLLLFILIYYVINSFNFCNYLFIYHIGPKNIISVFSHKTAKTKHGDLYFFFLHKGFIQHNQS